jgi:Tfp pilus assembly protein PilX
MQKLTRCANFPAGNDRGSALITAVVLALIMAFAGVGFLIVTTSSINNDSDAYTSERAFYAAESGALIAAKYLMVRSYNSWPSANPCTFYQDKKINGLYVTVTFIKDATLRQNTIKSEAYTSTAHSADTFRKRVTIVIQNHGF